MIYRHTHQLPAVPLNHESGSKQVLFCYKDKETPCRQISRARFKCGDHCEKHKHATLDEHFYWLEGEGRFILDGETFWFAAGDYIYVPAGADHEFIITADAVCLCIGIALDFTNLQHP